MKVIQVTKAALPYVCPFCTEDHQNKAMQHIAERFSMEMHSIDYETKEGELKMPDNNVDLYSYLNHHAKNNMLLLDLAYRRNVTTLLEYFKL